MQATSAELESLLDSLIGIPGARTWSQVRCARSGEITIAALRDAAEKRGYVITVVRDVLTCDPIPVVECYNLSYPGTPGSSASVQRCYRTEEAAERAANRELRSRKDLRLQDVRVTRVRRRVFTTAANLLECEYS